MIVSFVGLGMFLFLCRRLYFVKCKSVFMCGTEEKIEKTRSRFWQFFFLSLVSYFRQFYHFCHILHT